MEERGTRVSALVLVGYCLLQVCGAGNVTCTVTQNVTCTVTQNVTCTVTQTTYSVPDERASGCSYSWANASDTGHSVLAHEEGWKDGPVRSADVSTFITSECFPQVIYTRDCLSEKEEHTSNCTVVCCKKVVPPEDYVAEIKKTTSRSRIILVIIIIISFVIVLVGLIYFRTKTTCFYSPVNMKDVEAQAPVGQ